MRFFFFFCLSRSSMWVNRIVYHGWKRIFPRVIHHVVTFFLVAIFRTNSTITHSIHLNSHYGYEELRTCLWWRWQRPVKSTMGFLFSVLPPHPSIHFAIRLIPTRVAGVPQPIPTGEGHPEPVAGPSRGTQRPTNHSGSQTRLATIWSDWLACRACFWNVERNQHTRRKAA